MVKFLKKMENTSQITTGTEEFLLRYESFTITMSHMTSGPPRSESTNSFKGRQISSTWALSHLRERELSRNYSLCLQHAGHHLDFTTTLNDFK
jgi:hypothetical protein